MTEHENGTLSLTISAVEGAPYTEISMPLRVTFRNEASNEIRILAVFRPIPVFFSLKLTRTDGTPLNVVGAGKIDLSAADRRYETLKEGENYTAVIDFSEVLTTISLSRGETYVISLTYHNQYGEDCFQGAIHSNSLKMTIS